MVVMVTDLNCLYIYAYTLDTANYEPAMLEVTFVVKNLSYTLNCWIDHASVSILELYKERLHNLIAVVVAC